MITAFPFSTPLASRVAPPVVGQRGQYQGRVCARTAALVAVPGRHTELYAVPSSGGGGLVSLPGSITYSENVLMPAGACLWAFSAGSRWPFRLQMTHGLTGQLLASSALFCGSGDGLGTIDLVNAGDGFAGLVVETRPDGGKVRAMSPQQFLAEPFVFSEAGSVIVEITPSAGPGSGVSVPLIKFGLPFPTHAGQGDYGVQVVLWVSVEGE